MARLGPKCPACGSRFSTVIVSRPREFSWKGKTYVTAKRRRDCQHCGHSWQTVEMPEDDIDALVEGRPMPQDDPTLRTPRD